MKTVYISLFLSIALWTTLPAQNVGIGTNAPTATLDVNGQVRIRGGSPAAGKVLTSNGEGLASWQTPSTGLTLPWASSVSHTDYLFQITNTGSGQGIASIANATAGTQTGVFGESKADQGRGIQGYASSTQGVNYGVFGATVSTSGVGVYGQAGATSGSNVAVKGWVSSPDGYSGYFSGGRYYISGNTGIGTLNPSAKLEVAGQVKITGGNPASGKVLISDASGLASWQAIAPWLHNGTDIYLFNGNLGLGHTNPAARLDVSTTQGPNVIIRDANAGSGRPGIQFVNNNIHYIAGDDGSEEIFGIYAGYGSTRSYAARLNIHGPASVNWGKYLSLTHNGNHGFITTDAGYLILSPAGMRVGIGTESPAYALHVNGEAAKSSGTTAWVISSDSRLKDLNGKYTKGLKEISELQPIIYHYKQGNGRHLPSDIELIGFVAQDVQRIFPEAVSTGSDGYLDFNMHSVHVALVNAVKDLKAENDVLKQDNEILKLELKKINARLDAWEMKNGTMQHIRQKSME